MAMQQQESLSVKGTHDEEEMFTGEFQLFDEVGFLGKLKQHT